MLVVQVIEIIWTKATRGAPRSKERASLPRAFPIESGVVECLVQQYRMSEREAFCPKLVKSSRSLPLPGVVGVLRIAPEAHSGYVLSFAGTPNLGQPKRRPIQNALKVVPDEFVRVIVNARHTSYSGQSYSESIYNVACGERVAIDRFLSGKPDHELDLNANLF